MSHQRDYEVNLLWHSERQGALTSPGVSTSIAAGVPWDLPARNIDAWTPEHLLLASVNACLLATFLAIARNMNVPFLSFECNSVATVEKINDKLIFTLITLRPTVVLSSPENEERIRRILEISKKSSAISNLLKIKMKLEPRILIQELANQP